MYGILIVWIAAIGAIFLVVTVLIVANKAWRETRDGWHRSRRRVLEPKILQWSHGDQPLLLDALDETPTAADRAVIEAILLDHLERVRGIERRRLGNALDELGFTDRYLEGLESRRWWRRAECAERLGLGGAKRTVGSLIKTLDDEVPEVRLRAAKALGRLGGISAVRPLIYALGEPNRWSTIRIADILTSMGQEVVDELITTFPDLNLHARLAAIDILARIKALQAAEWLRLRIQDFEPDVRARACNALGSIGDTEAGPALIEALKDGEWPVRAQAAKALGRMRHVDAITELCTALRDREWWVRANAAEALKAIGDDGVVALRRMLDDSDTFARQQAVLMLQETGVVDQEVDHLADEDETRRAAAHALLERVIQIGQTARLSELAGTHPDPRVRTALLELLPDPDREAVDVRP